MTLRTPLELAAEAAWSARAPLKYDPISLDEIAKNEFMAGVEFGHAYALNSEPVTELVEMLERIKEHVYANPADAAQVALEAFRKSRSE